MFKLLVILFIIKQSPVLNACFENSASEHYKVFKISKEYCRRNS